MKVREIQNELLAEVGLGDVREKIAGTVADVSGKVGEFVGKAEDVRDATKDAAEMISKINTEIEDLKTKLTSN